MSVLLGCSVFIFLCHNVRGPAEPRTGALEDPLRQIYLGLKLGGPNPIFRASFSMSLNSTFWFMNTIHTKGICSSVELETIANDYFFLKDQRRERRNPVVFAGSSLAAEFSEDSLDPKCCPL